MPTGFQPIIILKEKMRPTKQYSNTADKINIKSFRKTESYLKNVIKTHLCPLF